MNAGKSAILLQAAYYYEERGMRVCLLTPRLDTRAGQGEGQITSRIGLKAPADRFSDTTDLEAHIRAAHGKAPLACVFVDEAQFLLR